MADELLTAAEAGELLGVTRQRLHHLRSGYKQISNGKIYTYDPVLIEGRDWVWMRGEIRYVRAAIERLLDERRK